MNDFATIDRLVNDHLDVAERLAVRLYCHRMDMHEAKSVAMSALFSAAQRWKPVRTIPFETFALLVVHRKLDEAWQRMHRQKRGRQFAHYSLDATVGEILIEENISEIPETRPHPAESFLAKLAVALVKQLPRDLRRAVELRFGINGVEREHEEKEIGKILHVSAGGVHKQLVRAINMLRAMLFTFDPGAQDRSPIQFTCV